MQGTEARAREPLSITPFDISHSSAAPVAAGCSESVSRNAGRRLQAFSSHSPYKGFGGWTGGGLRISHRRVSASPLETQQPSPCVLS